MGTFINIRGTNGSGKSTLARSLFSDGCLQPLVYSYTNERGKQKEVRANIGKSGVAVLGDYSTMAGGLDKIDRFSFQQEAIDAALDQFKIVVAEGVLASTVYGSWAHFADALAAKGHRTIWAYLATPGDECLRRIQVRNGGKPIKGELVLDKIRAIAATRARALRAEGHIQVLDLPYGAESEVLLQTIAAELDR